MVFLSWVNWRIFNITRVLLKINERILDISKELLSVNESILHISKAIAISADNTDTKLNRLNALPKKFREIKADE